MFFFFYFNKYTRRHFVTSEMLLKFNVVDLNNYRQRKKSKNDIDFSENGYDPNIKNKNY